APPEPLRRLLPQAARLPGRAGQPARGRGARRAVVRLACRGAVPGRRRRRLPDAGRRAGDRRGGDRDRRTRAVAPVRRRERAGGVELVRVADRADRAAALADADAVICMSLRPEETAGAERLRLVQALVAGVDGIVPEAIPAGCTLCNAYGHETAIGEWVLMS